MKLSKALEGFLLAKSADGLSTNTLDIYRWALDKLLLFLGDTEVEDITTDDLRRWFIWLREEYKPRGIRAKERLSIASIQDAWRALKSFYTWAKRDLGLSRMDDIKRPLGESPPVVPLSEDEIKALLKATEHYHFTRKGQPVKAKRRNAARNVAILMTLLDTGIRVGELTRLTISEVNVSTGEMVIKPFGSGRKSHGRIVYLGKVARKAIWRYLADRDVQPGDLLFLSDDERPMTRGSVLQMFIHLGQAAKVAHVHPHRFRHTFAIQFLRNGGNAFILQKLLGHKSLEMVKRYLRIVNEDAQQAMQTASPADRWHL
jgi:integrase/recombinase XerD